MKRSLFFLGGTRIYFLSLAFLLCFGILLLLLTGEATTFISLNTYHPFWLNVFFINYTFIGDGIFAMALISVYIFYFKKRREGLALLSAFLLSGFVVQLIKNLVNTPRPRLFFEPGQYLFFVNDVSIANNSSFPSGHTATAFAIATILIIVMKNKKWQLPVLAGAVLVGYSRIYLAQHFLVDILAGTVIGTGCGIISYTLLSRGIRFRRFSKSKIHYRPQRNMVYN